MTDRITQALDLLSIFHDEKGRWLPDQLRTTDHRDTARNLKAIIQAHKLLREELAEDALWEVDDRCIIGRIAREVDAMSLPEKKYAVTHATLSGMVARLRGQRSKL